MPVPLRWYEALDPLLVSFTPLVVFYLFTLTMILSSKQKLVEGSFFQIVVFTGLADILYFVSQNVYKFMINLGLGAEYDGLYRISDTLTEICLLSHVLCNLLATVCQYMAVCWQTTYGEIWTPSRTIFYLLCASILSTATFAADFFTRIDYTDVDEDGFYQLSWDVTVPVGFVICNAVLCVYYTASPLMVWRTLVALDRLGASDVLKRHYRALALVVLVDCLLFTLDILIELRTAFWCFEIQLLPNWLEKGISDRVKLFYYSLLHSANPLVLVLFSKTARQEVFRTCRRIRRVKTVSSVISS